MENARNAEAIFKKESQAGEMTIFEVAAEVADFLDEQGVAYAFLGGLVVQHWGEPRLTKDVDVVVVVSSERERAFLHAAVGRFRPRLENAVDFATRHRWRLRSCRC